MQFFTASQLNAFFLWNQWRMNCIKYTFNADYEYSLILQMSSYCLLTLCMWNEIISLTCLCSSSDRPHQTDALILSTWPSSALYLSFSSSAGKRILMNQTHLIVIDVSESAWIQRKIINMVWKIELFHCIAQHGTDGYSLLLGGFTSVPDTFFQYQFCWGFKRSVQIPKVTC